MELAVILKDLTLVHVTMDLDLHRLAMSVLISTSAARMALAAMESVPTR